MAGIKHLRQVYEKKGDNFLNNLLNNFVIINEQTNGTFFGVRKDKETDRFKYFKKSGEITYVDRMLMKFYNPAVAYFETLPDDKKQRIPSNFYFGFEFLSRRDGSKGNRAPKNNLILSYIHRLDDTGKPIETLQTKDDLARWAYYLDVEAPPIIFEGMLDDEQKNAMMEFVYSNPKDLEERFKTTSFTKYILSVLAPEYKPASNFDEIIFRFYDENDENPSPEVVLAKLVDPMFQGDSEKAPTKSKGGSDYIWLIVIDLMNHFEMYSEMDLRKMAGEESDYDQRYLNLINSAFKDFIKEYSYKYDGLQLDIPEYLKKPEFDVDYGMIQDQDITSMIQKNDTFREIYRILINFFRKVRKKSSANFFGPELLNQLNIQIKKIKRIIMGDAIYEGLFPSFGEFIGADVTDSGYITEHDHFKKNSGVKKKEEKVNLLIGSFQPPHNGHLRAAEELRKQNGLPCVLVAITRSKNPFSERSTRLLLEKIQQSHSDIIKEVRIIQKPGIKEILKEIKPDFDPILWGTTSKRLKDYVLQMDYIKKKNIPIRISDQFKLVELPVYQHSSEVIDSIKDSDFKAFKEKVPTCISSEFFNLQRELENNTAE
jgi:hypothetical protein